jgi:undecaprenyl pyrophosphate phosphatase UppP
MTRIPRFGASLFRQPREQLLATSSLGQPRSRAFVRNILPAAIIGATAYSLYKNWSGLSLDGGGLIAIGFVAAFLSALLVVRTFIGFIGRHGFAPFAWYRIAFGGLMLWLLLAR